MSGRDESIELTILMPCLNEAETIETCIRKSLACLQRMGVSGEVLIADNGSTDGSQEIATSAGARVVPISQRGYGAALIGGIQAARGRYIIMGDADDSYDFSRLDLFLEKLREGFDLVMGNRFKGGIAPGAMPPLHYYLGNPVLSAIGRVFFRSPIKDFHCGLRGFRKEEIERLELQTSGMEFASEMVVKATLAGLKTTEVATTLAKDGRSRPPHLRSWRDGWRHLRFLLIFSPRWLFLYPGLAMMLAGTILVIRLFAAPIQIGQTVLDVHTMLYAAASILLGFQAVLFAVFSKTFAINQGLFPPHPRLGKLTDWFHLERGLILSLMLFFAGLGCAIYATIGWGNAGFGALETSRTMRWVIMSVLLMTVGIQLAFSSFFMSVLGLAQQKQNR